jgi:serine/threonine protein kinase
MNTERWRRIEELYHAAVARSPEMRSSFLDTACGHDPELRREIESLLAQADRARSFLESRSTEATAMVPPVWQIGSYRILSPLGAGGMGEVYRAHDSKLARDVALKTLSAEFALDRERLERLRREARTLALLNHPNIAAIYGLEESAGVAWLVLELVEGETLRGPLPVRKALEYARQVAEALEAAHKKGVVHRDLKPANVKVTPEGRVKVLDFGLAKALWEAGRPQGPTQLDTLAKLTVAGQVAGTPGYMSPEQARGHTVDHRTDIWAFGCLLYELLAGRRAFAAATVPETLAVVLKAGPDWDALPKTTPARIRGLLRRCLEKDAGRRWADIQAARQVIEQVQRRPRRWPLAAATAGAALAASVISLLNPGRPADPSKWVQVTRLPDSVTQPALSPDGRMLAFLRGPNTFIGSAELYVKNLPDGEPVQLTHDQTRKMSPVFSPDGSRIAYTVLGEHNTWDTWTITAPAGTPQRWLPNAASLTWMDRDHVLFSEIKAGMHMAIVSSGENRAASRDVYVPAQEQGMAHRSYASPDGKWILLVEMNETAEWIPCRLVPSDGSSPGRPV